MSRLGLPVTHSGQKVIHLCVRPILERIRAKDDEGTLPPVELNGRQDNNPKMSRRVVSNELVDDITTQGCGTEDGGDFDRDDNGIGNTPTRIHVCIISPCW